MESAYGVQVLLEQKVSVTLEVGQRGAQRWLFTVESGRGVNCACIHCRRRASYRRTAYAILKAGLGSLDGEEQIHGSVCMAPLSALSLEVLGRTSLGLRAVAQERGVESSSYTLKVIRRLTRGVFVCGESCQCNLLEGYRCFACAYAKSVGRDLRWCLAMFYEWEGSGRRTFPWFSGCTDAVGTVQIAGGYSVNWLCCPFWRKQVVRIARGGRESPGAVVVERRPCELGASSNLQ